MNLVIYILGLVALRAHIVASCDTTEFCEIATSGAVEGVCAVGEAAGGAVTGAACTVGAVFTFGLSCGLALLGTGLLVGGCAAATSEIESGCECPEEGPNFNQLLDRLDRLNVTNQNGFNDILQKLNDQEEWFKILNRNDQKIIKGQVQLILAQNKMIQDLGAISHDLRNYKHQIKLTQIIAEFSRYLNNLETISNKFDRIRRGKLNTFIKDRRLEIFKNAAMDPADGLESSIDVIFKMLIGGGPWHGGQSLFKHSSIFCTPEHLQYFLGAQTHAIMLYKISLSFNSHRIDDKVEEDWVRGYVKSVEAYSKYCFCPPGLFLQKGGKISTLRSQLPSSGQSQFKNLQKISSSSADEVTEAKLGSLLELQNFDPNSEVIDLMKEYWIEDIDLYKQLTERGKISLAHVFDEVEKCVNISRNGGVEIQRRGPFGNPPDYFAKDFVSYDEGFSSNGEMWLGLKNIKQLIQRGYTELEMRFRDWDGKVFKRHYKHFDIDFAPDYKMKLRSAQKSFVAKKSNLCPRDSRWNGAGFSTKDKWQGFCRGASCTENAAHDAGNGGWWYESYPDSPNPNGLNTGEPKIGREFMGTPYEPFCDCIRSQEHFQVCEKMTDKGRQREALKSFKTSNLILYRNE